MSALLVTELAAVPRVTLAQCFNTGKAAGVLTLNHLETLFSTCVRCGGTTEPSFVCTTHLPFSQTPLS